MAGPGLLGTYEEERLPVAAWTLDVTYQRQAAVPEAIARPGHAAGRGEPCGLL